MKSRASGLQFNLGYRALPSTAVALLALWALTAGASRASNENLVISERLQTSSQNETKSNTQAATTVDPDCHCKDKAALESHRAWIAAIQQQTHQPVHADVLTPKQAPYYYEGAYDKKGKLLRAEKPMDAKCDGLTRPTPGRISVVQDLRLEMETYGDQFTNNETLTPVCPGFPRMSNDQKLNAWTWFWMVLANEEQSCDAQKVEAPGAKGEGHNPTWAIGLWSLEWHPQDRGARGSKCQGDLTDVHLQVTCAVHTMSKQLDTAGLIHSNSVYWGPLRNSDVSSKRNRYAWQIVPNMRKFPGCYDK